MRVVRERREGSVVGDYDVTACKMERGVWHMVDIPSRGTPMRLSGSGDVVW